MSFSRSSQKVGYETFEAFALDIFEEPFAKRDATARLIDTRWSVSLSTSAELNFESPVIITEPPTSTQNLNTDGTTSTVTMVAQDPEGFDINYGIAYKTASNALPDQLGSATTINQSTGVFTFTPSTTVSDAGTFRARLSASDGANTTTRLVDFALNFT